MMFGTIAVLIIIFFVMHKIGKYESESHFWRRAYENAQVEAEELRSEIISLKEELSHAKMELEDITERWNLKNPLED